MKSDNPYFKLINLNRTLSPYAFTYGSRLEDILGGKLMIDGRCPICQKCTRKIKQPCRYPDKRRSSLEAVGLNPSELSTGVLNHKIQWYRKADKKIIEPEYITVIHGLLTDSREPMGMIQ